MKVYIAGINVEELSGTSQSNEMIRIALAVEKLLPQIIKDGQKAFGKDAIILIVMREFAISNENAISVTQKKALLDLLNELISKYENVILIPGSFFVRKEFTWYAPEKREKKFQKICLNYYNLNEIKFFQNGKDFSNAYKNTQSIFQKKNLKTLMSVQNVGYILTSTSKIKHKKYVPTQEELTNVQNNDGDVIFDIGSDNLIKEIQLTSNKFKISLLICLEHLYITSDLPQIKANLPLFQIIISTWVGLRKNYLYGAINILMGRFEGLSVHINDDHEYASSVKDMELKAVCYTLEHGVFKTKNIPIAHFSNKLVKSSVEQSIAKPEDDNNNNASPVKQQAEFGKLFQELKSKASIDDVSTVEDIRKRDANVVQQMTKKFLG